jgi:hypothetical protein
VFIGADWNGLAACGLAVVNGFGGGLRTGSGSGLDLAGDSLDFTSATLFNDFHKSTLSPTGSRGSITVSTVSIKNWVGGEEGEKYCNKKAFNCAFVIFPSLSLSNTKNFCVASLLSFSLKAGRDRGGKGIVFALGVEVVIVNCFWYNWIE